MSEWLHFFLPVSNPLHLPDCHHLPHSSYPGGMPAPWESFPELVLASVHLPRGLHRAPQDGGLSPWASSLAPAPRGPRWLLLPSSASGPPVGWPRINDELILPRTFPPGQDWVLWESCRWLPRPLHPQVSSGHSPILGVSKKLQKTALRHQFPVIFKKEGTANLKTSTLLRYDLKTSGKEGCWAMSPAPSAPSPTG